MFYLDRFKTTHSLIYSFSRFGANNIFGEIGENSLSINKSIINQLLFVDVIMEWSFRLVIS